MINLRQVTLRRGTRVLLQNVNWIIYAQQRIGIIGANGAGKTTLFGLLLKEFQPDAGDIDIPRSLTLAHVAQETQSEDKSAIDYVLDGDDELRQLEAELIQAETDDDGMRIAEIYEQLGIIDAYTAPTRAAQLLSGLGFNAQEQQKSMREFSGGWRVRLNLAKALMTRSDMLLLDEPTNHLDLDAVLWLEQWLLKYPGTLLIISHDRDFLDATVNHIAHLHDQELKIYSGNYSSFETLRAAHLLQQQAVFEKQQRQLAHIQSYVDRFRYKASKARQAQSRLKAIERMELVCAVQSESRFQFSFRQPKLCPNPLLSVNRASIAYGDNVILKQLGLSLTPKDRIAILGPNGAGKSSFIKLLAGELNASTGHCERAAGLKIGYFAQHQVDHLHLNESPLEHFRRIDERTAEIDLRKFLGSFDFSGDVVFEPIARFSGGEKSRLALALIVWQQPNLLLLDEPTNHLDLEMRNALSLALQDYEGAMILVSHDRFLVRSTTDTLLLVAEGKMQEFDGDLNDYQQWLLNFRKAQLAPKTPTASSKPTKPPTSDHLKKLEAALNQLQQQAQLLENDLTDQTLYEPTHKQQLQDKLLALSEVKKQIDEAESAWLSACESQSSS